MIGMSIILGFTIIGSDEITLNFDLQKFIPLFFISILFIPIQTTEELFFDLIFHKEFTHLLKMDSSQF